MTILDFLEELVVMADIVGEAEKEAEKPNAHDRSKTAVKTRKKVSGSEAYGPKAPVVNIGSMIEDVVFNGPATIVLWKDGSKTVVKCDMREKTFDKEKGFAMAILKRICGNTGTYNDLFRRYIVEDDTEPVQEDVVLLLDDDEDDDDGYITIDEG